jgi:hypothetical protein
MLKALKVVLIADGVVLCVLGAALFALPRTMWMAFGFEGLPDMVNYVLGMWGALLATMGVGYFIASQDPARSHGWVWVGIARGILEGGVSAFYIATHVVTFKQGGLGLVLAVWFALAYIVFYPRRSAVPGAEAG